MTPAKGQQYLPVKDYEAAANAVERFTGALLLHLSSRELDTRHLVIRNFIARGASSLKSICHVWQLGHYQDCWILYRCLLDRLFHLKALIDSNEFELFEKWSFKEQIEANNRVISDMELKGMIEPDLFRPTRKQRERYAQLKAEGVDWHRPKAEVVAKTMDLPFLYKYGYDYASQHIHPMANDGQHDYLRVTRQRFEMPFDQRMILNNSLLVQIILTQEGLNASRLEWQRLVLNFLTDLMLFLRSGSQGYQQTLRKLMDAGPEFEWSQEATQPG